MSIAEKYSVGYLEQQSYRQLQKTAKSLNLPANVKKVRLIHLIHTNFYGSPKEIRTVVEGVKRERTRNGQAKKRKKRWMEPQSGEVSSSTADNTGHADRSPCIGETPKRLSTPVFGRYTPINRPNLLKYSKSTTVLQQSSTTTVASSSRKEHLKTYPSPKQSTCDRVLRNRRYPVYSKADSPKPQNYMDVVSSNDRAIKLNERQIAERSNRVKVVNSSEKGHLRNDKVQSKALEPKHRPAILSGKVSPPSNGPKIPPYKMDTHNRNERTMDRIRAQNAPIEQTTLNLTVPEVRAQKRQKRILSGIYLLRTEAAQNHETYEYVPRNLGIRTKDGTYTKVNGLVQKPRAVPIQNLNTNVNKENSKNQNTRKESNFEFTVQDILDGTIGNIPLTVQETPESLERYNATNYPNTYPMTYEIVSPTQNTLTNSKHTAAYGLDTPLSMTSCQPSEREPQNDMESFDKIVSTYYHKKICRRQSLHAEEVRAGRESLHAEEARARRELLYKQNTESNEQLPSISEVFSSFVTEPTTLQTHTVASLETLSYKIYNDHEIPETYVSEMNSNSKNLFLTKQPFKEIETHSGAVTRSVTMANTATVDAVTKGSNNYIMPANIGCSNDTIITYEQLPAAGMMQIPEQNNYGSTTAWVDQPGTQVLDAASECTESDMEEIMEWISQDGDYMERMGLDIVMGCMVCTWAGPKYNLEHHIIQAQHYIHKFDTEEWNVTFSLGALLSSGLWHSELIEGTLELYILSVKVASGILEATLTSLSVLSPEPKNGTITIYNAVSGEPHTWHGIIPPLPPLLPHENTTPDKLTVRLDKLDILPRSVCDKVVYGPPDYENIQITVFGKII